MSIDDPLILLEITSARSRDRDRDGKGDLYRQLASLRQYVLIERDRAAVQSIIRPDGIASAIHWSDKDALESTS